MFVILLPVPRFAAPAEITNVSQNLTEQTLQFSFAVLTALESCNYRIYMMVAKIKFGLEGARPHSATLVQPCSPATAASACFGVAADCSLYASAITQHVQVIGLTFRPVANI